jgi:hypothetical protein
MADWQARPGHGTGRSPIVQEKFQISWAHREEKHAEEEPALKESGSEDVMEEGLVTGSRPLVGTVVLEEMERWEMDELETDLVGEQQRLEEFLTKNDREKAVVRLAG